MAIENKLDALIASVDSLTKTVEPIRDDISTIKEMTTGWRAVGTVGRFIKWAGGIATAFVAGWVLFKAGIKALVL
ncbi:MAG: hypothetical protein RL268_195 [Pseudomonadota bacterium]